MAMEALKHSFTKIKPKSANFRLHSDLHLLVDEVRAQFGETAKKGPGSFSFYLGFFKRLGTKRVREILAEVKESKIDHPAKLFWWKIKQETKPNE